MEFHPIDLHMQDTYHRYLEKCPEYASDYSFTNIFGWKDVYGLSWAFTQDLVVIRQDVPECVFWAPVGNWQAIDWQDVLENRFHRPVQFIRVPEKLVEIWTQQLGESIQVNDARGSWDYLYSAEDLIALKGNKFHKKKNLVNQFRKNYPFSYRPFNQGLVGKALAMQENWCTWRDCESSEELSAENRVIEKILNHWENITGGLGGALFVDEDMVAYTIAEMITEDTLLIHFEKGDTEYKGIYQAINQIFLENVVGNAEESPIRFVNREPDVDNEGLRKAKLSYHPVDFIKKYSVTVR